jgi:hypothetical protein
MCSTLHVYVSRCDADVYVHCLCGLQWFEWFVWCCGGVLRGCGTNPSLHGGRLFHISSQVGVQLCAAALTD